jgi:simple sugar transport system permease protein
MIAGGLAGLGGALYFLSGAGVTMNVKNDLAAEGFTGISVALLGLSSPIGIIFAGILIAYLQLGGFQMQLFGFVPEIIEIVTAVIIYFCAFVLLVKVFFTRFTSKARMSMSEEADDEPPPGKQIEPPASGDPEPPPDSN